MDTESDRFVAAMHALPGEIFDKIREHVFTPDTVDEDLVVTERCQPSSLLTINRSTRSYFARRFYAQTRFLFFDMELLVRWFMALPRKHVNMLVSVWLVDTNGWELDWGVDGNSLSKGLWDAVDHRFKSLGVTGVQHRVAVTCIMPPRGFDATDMDAWLAKMDAMHASYDDPEPEGNDQTNAGAA